MENTEPKNTVCYRCGKFRGFYTKELSHFERSKFGYCFNQTKVVENLGSCENWCNGNIRLFASKKTSMKVLSELLANITGIKQILQEAQEGEKEINEKVNL